MKYISTRTGDAAGLSFCDTILEGLAPDGGLFLPERYPRVDAATADAWRTLLREEGYAALAFEVLRLFVDDIPDADLRGLCERAYTPQAFGSADVVGLVDLRDGLALGQVSNGPTAAFKDMAMQFLGQLFEYELERRDSVLNIVGATSGDTGSSAEHAMLGKQRVSVVMLTPSGRMTPFQQAQMFSLDDPRILNVAVDGVFDDCQDLVKALAGDTAFKASQHIGAVNSINWARVAAQVVYYCALSLLATRPGEKASFCVPTGNFGNVLAGHIARQMGLPIDTLIVATNENDVLAEFFATGVYRPRGASETAATSSPSMDISKASNFERFLFDLVDRNPAKVSELFAELAATGQFDVSDTPEFGRLRARFGVVAGSSTHADRVATIRAVHEESGVLIDPHTADGVFVARSLLAEGLDAARPVICLETALPVKFADTIKEATGEEPTLPDRFEGLLERPCTVVDLPNDVRALKDLVVAHIERSSGREASAPN